MEEGVRGDRGTVVGQDREGQTSTPVGPLLYVSATLNLRETPKPT